MSLKTLYILLSFGIFAIYNIFILIVIGIPENLSMSYYGLNDRRKGLGSLFPVIIILLCLTIYPAWDAINDMISPEGSLCRYLTGITITGLLVVAAIASYKKSKFMFVIHYTAAIVSGISSVLWIVFTNYRLMYIPAMVAGLALWAAWLSRTLKSKFFFWIEISNIYSIQIVLFILSIMSEK